MMLVFYFVILSFQPRAYITTTTFLRLIGVTNVIIKKSNQQQSPVNLPQLLNKKQPSLNGKNPSLCGRQFSVSGFQP